MVIMAALAVVLRRWSGQDDIVIGVPVNTRGEAGVSAVIGFFVNTVPVRVRVTGDPSFGELLRSVRDACLDSYVTRGETPFDVLSASWAWCVTRAAARCTRYSSA